MPKLDLTRALRIKGAGGEVAALKGAGFAWARPASGGDWTPADLPGLVVHIDARSVTGLADGELISSVTGASGTAITATSVPSEELVYRSDPLGLGFPGMHATAENKSLRLGSLAALLPTAASAAVIFRDTRVGVGGAYSGKHLGPLQTDANSQWLGFGAAAQGYPGVLRSTRLNLAWSEADLPGASAAALYDDATCIMVTTSDASGYDVHINGSRIKTGFAAGYAGGGNWRLGRTNTSSLVGYQFALIVGSGVWTTADRQKVEGWLAHGFGAAASLPADHPHKTAAP